MDDSKTSSADGMCGYAGIPKVYCHLMFGILALTVDQLMRLVL